jgi:hypothetical protein
MSSFLARFGHGITALPALVAFLLDRSGALSAQMTTIITVLSALFGAAHVAAILHSATLAKVQAGASTAASTVAGLSQLAAQVQQLLSSAQAGAPAAAATPSAK